MAQDSDQRPTRPQSPTPPPKLVELAKRLKHPQIMNVGLTTTGRGEWAARIRVKPGTPTPLAGIGQHHEGFPIVYEQGSTTPPVARPAFPEEERAAGPLRSAPAAPSRK